MTLLLQTRPDSELRWLRIDPPQKLRPFERRGKNLGPPQSLVTKRFPSENYQGEKGNAQS